MNLELSGNEMFLFHSAITDLNGEKTISFEKNMYNSSIII